MKAYLLSVGDEVLSGKVINTNAAYLAQELEKLGIILMKVISVGDEAQQIASVIHEFMESEATLLISTGGLGPTHDDFTKEVICETLGRQLVYNETASQDMLHYFGEVKSDCNAKQAYYPIDSILISNPIGSADGVIIQEKGKHLILLVGPTIEMRTLYAIGVEPYLQDKVTPRLIQDYLVMGQSESAFENILTPLFASHPLVTCAPYASLGVIRYRLIAKADQSAAFNAAKQSFQAIMGPFITSEDNLPIQEVICRLLDARHEIVSCAESMTGGLIAERLTSVAGASRVLKESYVVYCNQAKETILGVSPLTLETYQAVSEEVALEMVKGLQLKTSCDLALAITGFAGPDGAAVGTGWIGIAYHEQVLSFPFHVHGNREMIRMKACNQLLYHAYGMMRKGVL
ncbi:MAG: CinA family nicotinamide mononucleotide deamidase-related protein [Bacilli bacterium]